MRIEIVKTEKAAPKTKKYFTVSCMTEGQAESLLIHLDRKGYKYPLDQSIFGDEDIPDTGWEVHPEGFAYLINDREKTITRSSTKYYQTEFRYKSDLRIVTYHDFVNNYIDYV